MGGASSTSTVTLEQDEGGSVVTVCDCYFLIAM